MRIIILGSGTSTGVPAIGCGCAVCLSDNPKNKRMRPSALVEVNGVSILIDTSPDFREQALRFKIKRVDAVLYTHTHADHLHGIDDLRAYNFIQWASIPIFGSAGTMDHIRRTFDYIFNMKKSEGGGKPAIQTNVIDGDFEIAGIAIQPLKVLHGSLEILAYRIGPFAYLTDTSYIPMETMERIRGIDLLAIDALRYENHATHMSVDQAIAAAGEIRAKRTILTHFNHTIDHSQIEKALPSGIEPAYDGMEIFLDEK